MAAVLVTGGAGFIGSHLVDALLRSGERVTVIDDLSTGALRNLDGVAKHPALNFHRGSVLDTALMDRLVGEADLVYHLAAAVGVRNIVADPVSSILTNVRGTENVLAAAAEHDTRVVVASTSEIYGKSTAAPFGEGAERVLGPTWIPRWSYSTAKAIDEHLAFAYVQRGLPVGIVRYFNSYGPRIDERGYGSVIARFASQALSGNPLTVHGDGRQTRCFTYVDDTVRGTILVGTRAEALGRVFNIGATEEISIGRLAELVRAIVGAMSEIRHVAYESDYGVGFEDTRRRVPDTSLARDVLGFSASVDLHSGLERTLAWCQANYAVAGGS